MSSLRSGSFSLVPLFVLLLASSHVQAQYSSAQAIQDSIACGFELHVDLVPGRPFSAKIPAIPWASTVARDSKGRTRTGNGWGWPPTHGPLALICDPGETEVKAIWLLTITENFLSTDRQGKPVIEGRPVDHIALVESIPFEKLKQVAPVLPAPGITEGPITTVDGKPVKGLRFTGYNPEGYMERYRLAPDDLFADVAVVYGSVLPNAPRVVDEMANIVRGEPDPALFTIPSNYRVVTRSELETIVQDAQQHDTAVIASYRQAIR